MIQVPFNSFCVALQYETGTKFFHLAIPELHAIKNGTKIVISPYTFTYNQRYYIVQASYIAANYQRRSKAILNFC